jgi:hypothetical protein
VSAIVSVVVAVAAVVVAVVDVVVVVVQLMHQLLLLLKTFLEREICQLRTFRRKQTRLNDSLKSLRNANI